MTKEQIEVYAGELVERLICLKDTNRSTLTRNEIDTINAVCNILDHNKKRLEEI